MDNHENSLVIFSITAEDRTYLTQTLTRIFRNYLEIISLSKEEAEALPFHPKAVLVTKLSEALAVNLFPDSKLINIDRMISGYNLERVMLLPKNSTALVANMPKSAAIETVSNLYSMGIKQIKLVPYWPESKIDASLYDSAIYTGFKHYAPEGMKNYIDIGHRTIAITTLVEIIKTFNIPSECLNKYTEHNVRQIVNTCYQVVSSYKEVNNLKESFEHQCNNSPDASVYIDHRDRVTIFNPGAEQTFNLKRDSVIGYNYQQCFSSFPQLVDLITKGKPLQDHFITLSGNNYLLSLSSIADADRRKILLNITPVETLQRSEAKVRKKLHAKGFSAKYTFGDIVGSNEETRRAVNRAKHYAESNATILIIGDSGTGKELFAQSIHNASIRKGEAFVGLNFAALPENLAESELFGHEEGAFTGATKGGKAGLFEIAHKGTIFLDEIGDASLSMQIRLLRVIEEREIIRVGSSRVIPVDIRIICATNKDLGQLVREGKFRHDLYYRICILPLKLPPLRERRDDIAVIMRKSPEFSLLDKKIADDVVAYLCGLKYNWPGNVRELKAIMKYLSVMYRDRSESPLRTADLLEEMHFQFFGLPVNSVPSMQPIPRREVLPVQADHLNDEMLAILASIDSLSQNGQPVGRYSLAKTDMLQQMHLSEAKTKTRLKKLAALGYIIIRKTKQGVGLSEMGKEALIAFRANP